MKFASLCTTRKNAQLIGVPTKYAAQMNRFLQSISNNCSIFICCGAQKRLNTWWGVFPCVDMFCPLCLQGWFSRNPFARKPLEYVFTRGYDFQNLHHQKFAVLGIRPTRRRLQKVNCLLHSFGLTQSTGTFVLSLTYNSVFQSYSVSDTLQTTSFSRMKFIFVNKLSRYKIINKWTFQMHKGI